MIRGDDFDRLAQALCTAAPGADRVTLFLAGESTDFIRFNHAQVRQATHVDQLQATVTVVAGLRRASGTVTLSGRHDADVAALRAERDQLLHDLPLVPEDRHLLLPGTVHSTRHEAEGALPAAQDVIAAVARHAEATDLVGIHTGGSVLRAFADSRGQRNWHRAESFALDWCLYREGDQAVKSSYAGTHWDESQFAAKMGAAREQLGLLALPRRTLAPGAYRAWFSPVAMGDLLGTLCWSGFSRKQVATGTGSLVRMHQAGASMHPTVHIAEEGMGGIAPNFQADGFVKPDRVPLIEAGRATGTLVSPRTAREYGLAANGANAGEYPESLTMAPGTLADADVLRTLGTGVYLSNLHYLNYSDRQACCMTGMTRFACFWVERGELVAPIHVMRFDDSLLRMLGEGLVALSDRAELIPDDRTYGARFLASVTTPGAIVEGFRLTL